MVFHKEAYKILENIWKKNLMMEEKNGKNTITKINLQSFECQHWNFYDKKCNIPPGVPSI